MREFEFIVRYREGADRLMDRFIEAPEALAASTTCCVTRESMWRVDHLRGPQDALDRIEEVYLDDDWCNECLHDPPCDSCRRYTLLDRKPTARTVYGYREEIQRCRSIPYLTVDRVGDGVLFETERRGDEYRWRVLLPEERCVGALYDDIDDRMREGLELDLHHVGECTAWERAHPIPSELSPDQIEAVAAAIEAGYYEAPRQTTVGDLADRLDVPRSTLQYRLQRAEGEIMDAFVERWGSLVEPVAGN